jgi:hypothetical protein
MKHWVLAALLLLCAAPSHAVNLRQKWGLGAGFTHGAPVLSIIRGRSARTAWVLNLGSLPGSPAWTGPGPDDEPAPASHLSRDFAAISGGPALRYYLRQDSDLSPYCDVYVSGTYLRGRNASLSTNTYSNTLASTGVDLGLEYCTPWKLAFGAHSRLASLTWDGVQSESMSGIQKITVRGSREVPTVGLRPYLFVRAYF